MLWIAAAWNPGQSNARYAYTCLLARLAHTAGPTQRPAAAAVPGRVQASTIEGWVRWRRAKDRTTFG
jgi:hypothetical protein